MLVGILAKNTKLIQETTFKYFNKVVKETRYSINLYTSKFIKEVYTCPVIVLTNGF